jgi:hypothetical protein
LSISRLIFIVVKNALNKSYSGKLNTHVWYTFSVSLVVFHEITLEAGHEFWASMKYLDYPFFFLIIHPSFPFH